MRLTLRQLKTLIMEELKWRKPKKGEQAKFPGMYKRDPRRLLTWEVDEDLGPEAQQFHRKAAQAFAQETRGKLSNPEDVYNRGWVWVSSWKNASPIQYGLSAASDGVLGHDVFSFDLRPPWKTSIEKRKQIASAI